LIVSLIIIWNAERQKSVKRLQGLHFVA